MHPTQAAPCQGGQVLSALSLSLAAASGIHGVSNLFPESHSGFDKKACIPPVHPSSTLPHPANFLSNCHAASCLCYPFPFIEYAQQASPQGSRIFPVSRIIFLCCIDKGKCLARDHLVSWCSSSPSSRLESSASCSLSGCSWGDKGRILKIPARQCLCSAGSPHPAALGSPSLPHFIMVKYM